MRPSRLLALGAAMALAGGPAHAASELFSYWLNIDGVVSVPSSGDPIPAGVDVSAFDGITGLGTMGVEITGAGIHYVGLFLDHEIDVAVNTFFNETGAAFGAPGAGLSWEIDEPGFTFGDIDTNFAASALDNSNALVGPEDVSMAQAFSVALAPLEIGIVTFAVGETEPTSGFFLRHSDPDSDETIFFQASLAVRSIPEPAAAALVSVGMLAVGAARRRS